MQQQRLRVLEILILQTFYVDVNSIVYEILSPKEATHITNRTGKKFINKLSFFFFFLVDSAVETTIYLRLTCCQRSRPPLIVNLYMFLVCT